MEPKGVLVVGEITEGRVSLTSREVLAVGRKLADELGQELAIGLLGTDVEGLAREAFSYGADKVYVFSHPLLGGYQVDLHLAALDRLCREVSPNVLLMARTAVGREVAPRLAFRLGVGLVQDCLEVRIDPETGRLLGDRPVYGGNAVATVACMDTPQMAAVRPKAYEPLEPDESREGEVVLFNVELDPSIVRVKVVDVVKEEAEGVKLEDAKIVVAGGRGLGGPEPFKDLEELARVIGAGIGASRAAVDSGWVPPNWQIGLTGKSIAPDLYITVGISGASQHMAGCSGARVIVAINKDSEANIFKESRYGVVGGLAEGAARFYGGAEGPGEKLVPAQTQAEFPHPVARTSDSRYPGKTTHPNDGPLRSCPARYDFRQFHGKQPGGETCGLHKLSYNTQQHWRV